MHKTQNDVQLFLSLQDVSLRFYARIVFPNISWHFYNNPHLGLWDIKRKPRALANTPPIDMFPAYGRSPAPTADRYSPSIPGKMS